MGGGAQLELADVHFAYGSVPVLFGVSFEVRPGEVLGLLGTNGAGKSTVLRVAAGLAAPTSGAVRLDGHDITSVPAEQRCRLGFALVIGGRGVFPDLTVRENLELGAEGAGRDSRDAAAGLGRVLELLPALGSRLDQRAGTLSGGEQQMLSIGRALMARPRLLLLDEPSSGLAPAVVDRVFDLVAELRTAGTAVLVVEQNAALALGAADRGYVMDRGAIVAEGTAQGLRTGDEVRRALLGEPTDV